MRTDYYASAPSSERPCFNDDMLEALCDSVEGPYNWYTPYGEAGRGKGTGGRLNFGNGYCLSVSFHGGNYCDQGRTTAETAVIAPNGEFFRLPGDSDDVQGWQTWEDVCALAQVIAELP